jgi:hypothetical protein
MEYSKYAMQAQTLKAALFAADGSSKALVSYRAVLWVALLRNLLFENPHTQAKHRQ